MLVKISSLAMLACRCGLSDGALNFPDARGVERSFRPSERSS